LVLSGFPFTPDSRPKLVGEKAARLIDLGLAVARHPLNRIDQTGRTLLYPYAAPMPDESTAIAASHPSLTSRAYR
jgi:hypothetical protein